MNYLIYVFLLWLFSAYSANAIEVIVNSESSSEEVTPLIDALSVSTGGSGGEDRLTKNLKNVFISTGGSGGEDRLFDLFGDLSVSTGGSGGEDRFTDIFDGIVDPANGTLLSDFLATIVLTEPTSTVFITAYDLFEPLYVSNEVVGLFGGYSQYRVESHSVPETASVALLLLGMALLYAVQFRSRKAQYRRSI